MAELLRLAEGALIALDAGDIALARERLRALAAAKRLDPVRGWSDE